MIRSAMTVLKAAVLAAALPLSSAAPALAGTDRSPTPETLRGWLVELGHEAKVVETGKIPVVSFNTGLHSGIFRFNSCSALDNCLFVMLVTTFPHDQRVSNAQMADHNLKNACCKLARTRDGIRFTMPFLARGGFDKEMMAEALRLYPGQLSYIASTYGLRQPEP